MVFGGCWWGDEFKVTDEVREYDMTKRSWRSPKPAGALPCARYRHSMCLLPGSQGKKCVMYGGYVSTWRDGCPRLTGEWCYNRCDMHILDVDTYMWTRVKLTGQEPLPRGAHSCVPVGDSRLFFFGGGVLYFDGREHMEADCDELFTVDTQTWTLEYLSQGACMQGSSWPNSRGSHGASLVACGKTVGLLVLGGRDYNRCGTTDDEVHRGRDDGWMLTFAQPADKSVVFESAAGGS